MAKGTSFLVRCEPEQLTAWKAAALNTGEDLSVWVRRVLNVAVVDERAPPEPIVGHPVVSEPPPQMVPRPRPQKKLHHLLVPNDVPIPNAADVIGVIKAPAREVPLPPVKSRRKITAGDARAVQEFEKDADKQASPSGAKPLPVGELPIGDDRQPITLPGPDVVSIGRDGKNFAAFSKPVPPDFDDLPQLESSPEQTLDEARNQAMNDLMEMSRPKVLEEVEDIVAHVEKAPKRPGFKRSQKCTSSKCERLQLACCGACIHANAGKIDIWDREDRQPIQTPGPIPVSIGWVGPKPAWNRHPKCVTKKCERMGPCCELCRQANAIGF